MFKLGRRSPRGMTTVELMIGVGIFASIMAIALTILNHWMNVSRTSDYRLNAIDQARKAMLLMAKDIRRSEYIVTNNWVTLDPAPPAPYPNYAEHASSQKAFPMVVQSLDTMAVKYPALLNRTCEELKTNSIALVCSDAVGDNEVKSYILYYASRYQVGNSLHVGLFRYEFKDSTANYRFYSKVTGFDTGTPSAEIKIGTPATPLPAGAPNPYPSPIITRLVDDLLFTHDPEYNGNKYPVAYLFRIYNLHPYSNDNWMSPFYVDVSMSVSYARKVLEYLNLNHFNNSPSTYYDTIHCTENKADSEINYITLRTVALAKGVLMPK